MRELSKKELISVIKLLQEDITKRVKKSGSNGVVIGISGGIDSAVTCALCAGVVDTLGLFMPEKEITPPEDADDALFLCRSLDVPYRKIDITKPLHCMIDAYPLPLNKYCISNITPRLRMSYLYATANLEKRIVAGTSNKTERLLGYSTKWGDNASDFCSIGNLWKTEVFKIGKILGIQKSILEKAPSARLFVGQTDENDLGGKYEVIDEILYLMTEKNKTPEEAGRRVENITLAISLNKRIKDNAHKRVMPPCPEVGL